MLILYPAPQGALTQLYAGTMPEALNHNGEVRLMRAHLLNRPIERSFTMHFHSI